MSKRAAQGPQGEKGIDLREFNMSSTPDDKPQRATAAQLANRKIAGIRRRPRPGSAPGTGAAQPPSFSPFNSLDPNTVASTPAAASQPSTSNGFTFGQSQSFPGASSSTSQINQNASNQNASTPFTFGGGGGSSSSFSFSSSTFGGPSATSNNPFASMSTGGSNQQPTGNGFTGFKGSMFNIPPTGSETSNSAQQPSGGVFGTQPNTTTGGILGGNMSTTSTLGLSRPGIPAFAGGMFGQANKSGPSASPSVFGQTATETKPAPFGQSIFGAPKAQPVSSIADDSMQTSPDAKSNLTSSNPSIFGKGGASQTGIGASTNLSGFLFGGKPSSDDKPVFSTSSTPVKPLFGGMSAVPSTPSVFAPTTTAPAPTEPTTAAGTVGAITPSLFTTASTSQPAAPSQSSTVSNIFAKPATPATPSQASQEKKETSEKPNTALFPKTGFQPGPSSPGGTSLFSKSEATAPAAVSNPLFGAKPAFGASQPASTSNIFAPKPATSGDNIATTTPQANPFASLFGHKPATAGGPAQEQPKTPQTPATNIFSPKAAPSSGVVNKSEASKTTSAAPLFFTPTQSAATTTPSSIPAPATAPPKPFSNIFAKPSTTQAATATTSSMTSENLFKTNGTDKAATAPVQTPIATPSKPASGVAFEDLRPASYPSNLTAAEKEQYELVHNIRMLNRHTKNHINSLDPDKDDFDAVILYYMYLRDLYGVPIGERYKPNCQASAKPMAEILAEAKKATSESVTAHNKSAVSPTQAGSLSQSSGSVLNIAPSTITNTPSKLFGSEINKKRKSDEEEDADADSSSPHGKRTKGSNDSTTANIFANTLSKSTNSTEVSKPQPAPSSKPIASHASATAPANPFTLKPAGNQTDIPKFGTGGATNFFSQFKKQSDQYSEKQREKRKAEEFDSDEDDEAEWERKDAEQQKRKREEVEAHAKKRAKFVPGKGFVFEDKSEPEAKKTESVLATNGTSAQNTVTSALDSQTKAPFTSKNIFGHLSATPSDAEAENDDDDDDDTEAASAEKQAVSKPPSVTPASEGEASQEGSKALPGTGAEVTANGSSDERDSTKPSKETESAAKTTEDVETRSGSATPVATSTGRSIFDRIQYDKEGKPKRQSDDQNLGSLFSNSESASVNIAEPRTPPAFTANSRLDLYQRDTSGSTSAPSSVPSSVSPGVSGTASLTFGSRGNLPPSHPLYGISDMEISKSKDFHATSAPAANASNQFSLFGGQASTGDPFASQPAFSGQPSNGVPSGSQQSFGGQQSSGSQQSSTGFSFGGPSQQASSFSFMPPSTTASIDPSRSTTPGLASDTGADQSMEGDAAEPLPQVDLARGGAGEENEDPYYETRARAMRFEPGQVPPWQSKGVGYLKILRHRQTGRSRILLRADPSGNIVLNANLMKEITYKASGSSVQFMVPQVDGTPETWAIRVKKEEVAHLAAVMEQCKT